MNATPADLPPLLPEFIRNACKRIRVQAEKMNGIYKVKKAAIIAGIKGKDGKQYRGYACVAEFLEIHPLFKNEFEIPEADCEEIK